MLSSSVSILASVAVLLHGLLGCCWHHQHSACAGGKSAAVRGDGESQAGDGHAGACHSPQLTCSERWHHHDVISLLFHHDNDPVAHPDAGSDEDSDCQPRCSFVATPSVVLTFDLDDSMQPVETVQSGAAAEAMSAAHSCWSPPETLLGRSRCALFQVWLL